MVERGIYFAREAAERLGLSLDAFYACRRRLEAAGMPGSLTSGRIRIPRAAFEHWLASWQGAPATRAELEHWRSELARAYGSQQ